MGTLAIQKIKKGKQTHSLSPVVEETGFVGLNYNDVKEVPPVPADDVVHASIPEEGKGGGSA